MSTLERLVWIIASIWLSSPGCASPTPAGEAETTEREVKAERTRPEATSREAPEGVEAESDSAATDEAGASDEVSEQETDDRRAGAVVEGMSRRQAAEALQDLVADADERRRKVVVELRTTLDYGCPCPTWTFAPLHSGPPHGFPYAMILPSEGLRKHPTDYAVPGVIYRMRGHFDGRRISGLEWVEARGAEPPSFPDGSPPLEEYWKDETGPVFVVDQWCWVPKSIDFDYDRREKLQDDAPRCDASGP